MIQITYFRFFGLGFFYLKFLGYHSTGAFACNVLVTSQIDQIPLIYFLTCLVELFNAGFNVKQLIRSRAASISSKSCNLNTISS